MHEGNHAHITWEKPVRTLELLASTASVCFPGLSVSDTTEHSDFESFRL